MSNKSEVYKEVFLYSDLFTRKAKQTPDYSSKRTDRFTFENYSIHPYRNRETRARQTYCTAKKKKK